MDVRGLLLMCVLLLTSADDTAAVPLAPRLAGPGQDVVVLPPGELRFPFWARGLPDVRVHVFEAPTERFGEWRSWLRDVREHKRDDLPPFELLGTVDVTIAFGEEEVGRGYADLSPWLGADRSQVVVVYRRPQARTCSMGGFCGSSWVQSTDVGLSVHAPGAEVFARATDLRTGAPLAGMEVELQRAGRRVSVARTNRQGLASLGPNGTETLTRQEVIAWRDGKPAALLPCTIVPRKTGPPRSSPLHWGELGPVVARPGDRLVWVGLRRRGPDPLRGYDLDLDPRHAQWRLARGREVGDSQPVAVSPRGIKTVEVTLPTDQPVPHSLQIDTHDRVYWPGTRINHGSGGHWTNAFVELPSAPHFLGEELPITLRPSLEDGEWRPFHVSLTTIMAPLRAPPEGWRGWSFRGLVADLGAHGGGCKVEPRRRPRVRAAPPATRGTHGHLDA